MIHFCLQREIPHRDSDAFLLVYSLEDRRSLSVVAQIVRQMRYKYKITSPIFLVANKMDLVRNQSLTKEDGKLLAREHKCKYSETSLVQENDLDAFIITILQGIAVEDELYSDIEYRNNEIESKKKKHKGPILRLLSKLSKCYSS
ncbi:GTP-binding protein Rit2-like [Saccostrea cucullata]|uniref:GTP-binding protein Rit2-like n=1 Tax=Saccostrea cuccullata TaxID=36930 RepID=UPI002ED005F3